MRPSEVALNGLRKFIEKERRYRERFLTEPRRSQALKEVEDALACLDTLKDALAATEARQESLFQEA